MEFAKKQANISGTTLLKRKIVKWFEERAWHLPHIFNFFKVSRFCKLICKQQRIFNQLQSELKMKLLGMKTFAEWIRNADFHSKLSLKLNKNRITIWNCLFIWNLKYVFFHLNFAFKWSSIKYLSSKVKSERDFLLKRIEQESQI